MLNTRIIIGALATAGAFFVSTQVIAQTPTLIYACVNNNSGTIHIVAPNAACSRIW